MKLLVTGAAGLLGSNFVDVGQSRGWDVVTAVHTQQETNTRPNQVYELDIRNTERIRQVVQNERPDWVINCAAITDVDGCERTPEKASEVNSRAAGELARISDSYGSSFCQISTDYIFGAAHSVPIAENASPDPLQMYGQTKRDGENRVQKYHERPLIARVSFLFGVRRTDHTLQGLPRWILDRLSSGESAPLYTDQCISPTIASHAANSIADLLEVDAWGVFHCANKGCTTPYELGHKLLEHIDMSTVPGDITSSSVQQTDFSAKRPKYSCLAVEKIANHLGRQQPTWEDGLTALSDDLRSYTRST